MVCVSEGLACWSRRFLVFVCEGLACGSRRFLVWVCEGLACWVKAVLDLCFRGVSLVGQGGSWSVFAKG